MKSPWFMNMSAGARAAFTVGALLLLLASAVIGDFAISSWRANQAVQNSQQDLCAIVRLVTRHPVPKPANPAQNPSRVASYEFYEAFVTLGMQYRC